MHRVPYRIQRTNGKFNHMKATADEVRRIACTIVGAPLDTDTATLEKHWGVKITRMSTKEAEAIGM